MSLATVASLRQHPPGVPCQLLSVRPAENRLSPRCTDQLMILQTARRSRRPGVGTRAPQVGADAAQLWVRGARFIWTARFSLSSGARAAEWSPPCSSSCCTWWSRTSWSAAGCTTGNTEPSRASEPQDLCCAQGVFARSLRACWPRGRVQRRVCVCVHVCFMDLSVLALVGLVCVCACVFVHLFFFLGESAICGCVYVCARFLMLVCVCCIVSLCLCLSDRVCVTRGFNRVEHLVENGRGP